MSNVTEITARLGEDMRTKFIEGFVPGLPVAQPRHRVGVIAGHARMFEAPKRHPIHDWKAGVRLALSELHAKPREDGVCVVLEFWFPRPGRLTWKKREMPELPHVSRPDVDNLAKAFMDAASGIAWKDDAQVYALKVMKFYVAGGSTPGMKFRIY